MLKISCRILDVYDDDELVITGKIASVIGTGVMVADRDVVDGLKDHQFGLVMKTANGSMRRRLPLFDADSVKVSRAFFNEIRASLPDELAANADIKIAAAEAVFLHPETATDQDRTVLDLVAYVDIERLAPPRAKVAFHDQCWGLAIDGKNYFPLHDGTLLKTALARFVESASELQPEERFVYARNIVKRAEVLNVPIPSNSMVNWYSGEELNHNALRDAIDDRRKIIKAAGGNIEILSQLEDSAGIMAISDSAHEDMGSVVGRQKKASAMRGRLDIPKIISTLQTIDKLAGFSNHEYMRGLLDPFAAVFKSTGVNKFAALNVDGINLGDLKMDELNQKFSPDFVREFQQNPVVIYQSLPEPMKAAIRQLCTSPQGMDEKPNTLTPGSDPQNSLNPHYANG